MALTSLSPGSQLEQKGTMMYCRTKNNKLNSTPLVCWVKINFSIFLQTIRKKGSQQTIKTVIMMPSVRAAFLSLEREIRCFSSTNWLTCCEVCLPDFLLPRTEWDLGWLSLPPPPLPPRVEWPWGRWWRGTSASVTDSSLTFAGESCLLPSGVSSVFNWLWIRTLSIPSEEMVEFGVLAGSPPSTVAKGPGAVVVLLPIPLLCLDLFLCFCWFILSLLFWRQWSPLPSFPLFSMELIELLSRSPSFLRDPTQSVLFFAMAERREARALWRSRRRVAINIRIYTPVMRRSGMKNEPKAEYTTYPGWRVRAQDVFSSKFAGQSFQPVYEDNIQGMLGRVMLITSQNEYKGVGIGIIYSPNSGGEEIIKDMTQTTPIVIRTRCRVRFRA